MNGRRSWRAIGLALLAIQITLAGALFFVERREASAVPAAPNLEDWDFPIPDMSLTIESGIERANLVAVSWHEDAELAFVSMQIDWATTDPPATTTSVSAFGWLRLMYLAPVPNGSSDFAALSLTFERVSGQLTGASVRRWGSSPPSEPLFTNITVSSETAILAGELSGGTAFRAACPTLRFQSGTTLTVDQATNERFWTIVYRDRSDSTTGPMRLTVNATTGQVEDVAAGALACTG